VVKTSSRAVERHDFGGSHTSFWGFQSVLQLWELRRLLRPNQNRGWFQKMAS